MRLSALSVSSPERASSMATPSRARGERSSWEISRRRRRSAASRVSMRSAMRSKVRASWPSSSRRAALDARHDEEEPEPAVIAGAGDGGIAGAEDLVEDAALGVADEVGAVFVGEQVAAVFVGQDAAGVIDAMQGIEEGLESGAAADLVGAGGFFQLEADQAGDGGALVAIVFIDVERGDEGRADYRDSQGEPEPQQDFGEEGVHSAAASSGVRQN